MPNKSQLRQPAVTASEIAARLFTISKRLEGQRTGLDGAETQFIAKKLRIYALRLRTLANPPQADETTRLSKSINSRVRIRRHQDE